ncbi:B12-binding domain-containing radical SAM protein [Patescibacteria group bacterium]
MAERNIHLVNTATDQLAYFGRSIASPLGLREVGCMVMDEARNSGFGNELGFTFVDEHLGHLLQPEAHDLILVNTLTTTRNRAIALANQAQDAGALAIFGGPEASLRPELFTDHGVVFQGEAVNSRVFRAMTQEYLHDAKLKEGIYISEGVANPKLITLENIPFDEEIHRAMDGSTLIPSTYLAIGCPYRCAFCAAHILSGRTVRTRPVEEVIEEIKIRGLNGLSLIDSNPPFSPQWNQFLEEMEKLSLPNGWTVELSMNFLEGDKGNKLLRKLEKAQCQRIMIGIESPFPENLEDVDKRQNLTSQDILRQTQEIVAKMHQHGIKATLLFIVGFPKDNREKIMQVADFIQQVKADGVNIFILTPLPNTDLWQDLIGQELFYPDSIPPELYDLRHPVWNHPMGREALEQAYQDLCRKVWGYSRMLPRIARAIALPGLTGAPTNLGQRLRSSVGYELGSRHQHTDRMI